MPGPAGLGAFLTAAGGEVAGQGVMRLLEGASGQGSPLDAGSRFLPPRESLANTIKAFDAINFRRGALGLPQIDPYKVFDYAQQATQELVGDLRKFEMEKLLTEITGRLEQETIAQEGQLRRQEVSSRADVAKGFLQSSIENILGRPDYGMAESLKVQSTPV